MKGIVVDDERIILTSETNAIKRVLPHIELESFQKAKDAIEYMEKNKIDIAFLDINMKGTTGLELAKILQANNPKVNIIFCTGYSEYSLEALDLYCSAYLMKPITDDKLKEALKKLRYPISEKINGLKVQCFGNFEVYMDGKPIEFKNKKTKELFAFLIDRRGAAASTKDIVIALFEEDDKDSYVRNLRSDLNNTFEQLGISDALVHTKGDIGVNADKISCDYYDYLKGKKSLFKGEYMSQYSLGEMTLANLLDY